LPERETWLSAPNAIAIVVEALPISLGAAGAALCDACAAGTVRWRDDADDSFAMPIRVQPGLTRRAWAEGHIDFDRAELVSGRHRYELCFLLISGSDLLFWLSQQPNRRAGNTETKPAEPTTKTRPKYTVEEIQREVDDYLASQRGKRVPEKAYLPAIGARLRGAPRAAIRRAVELRQPRTLGRPKKSPQ
jgi:hypothetical protein